MNFLNQKIKSLSDGIKESIGDAKEKVSNSIDHSVLNDAKEKISNVIDTSSIINEAKEKVSNAIDASILDEAKEKFNEAINSSIEKKDLYVEKLNGYKEISTEKVTSYFKTTFEVDKTTEAIIDDIKNKLPTPVTEVNDIFEQCKKEAIQRAISAFCLAPIVGELDKHSEAKYDNLSVDYSTFEKENILDDTQNYANRKNEKYQAKKQWTQLEDGYNSSNTLDPYFADIEHIIPKKEIYENLLLKIATTNDEIIDSISFADNLIFADRSLNRSKGADDLMDYINNGIPDLENPDILHFKIGKDNKDITLSKSDAIEKYEKAKQGIAKMQFQAMKEVGMTAFSSGARMAVQQVVGLIIVETIDIFMDEIKDVTINGNFYNNDSFATSVIDRKDRIVSKLTQRFEERDIINKAKKLGVNSGIAGVLSVIPQILISLLVKMPSFVLSMIRECTLSIVRCVRVLLEPNANKYDSIKVIMAGTASAVLGVYIGQVISRAIIPVPLLNTFNRQVTEVLTGVFVMAIPLSAIYVIDKNKSKFTFKMGRS